LVLKTSSHIILEALEAMRYDWDDNHGLFSSTSTRRSRT